MSRGLADVRGWSTRDLRALCPCVRSRVEAVRELYLHRVAAQLKVIETARDMERQAEYVRLGASKPATMEDGPHRGKHLTRDGRIPERVSDARVLACDMAPAEYLSQPKWNPGGRLWLVYGELALARGLEWGGTWDDTPGRAPYDGWDRPHVYLRECRCR
jgi:hypothetical protein